MKTWIAPSSASWIRPLASAFAFSGDFAGAHLAQLRAAGLWREPIVTRIESYKRFYPAEAHHQDYMRKNPNQPYIVYHDRPKLIALERQFPELVKGAAQAEIDAIHDRAKPKVDAARAALAEVRAAQAARAVSPRIAAVAPARSQWDGPRIQFLRSLSPRNFVRAGIRTTRRRLLFRRRRPPQLPTGRNRYAEIAADCGAKTFPSGLGVPM